MKKGEGKNINLSNLLPCQSYKGLLFTLDQYQAHCPGSTPHFGLCQRGIKNVTLAAHAKKDCCLSFERLKNVF